MLVFFNAYKIHVHFKVIFKFYNETINLKKKQKTFYNGFYEMLSVWDIVNLFFRVGQLDFKVCLLKEDH